MKRSRSNHTAVCKAKLALAAIRGEKTLAELSAQYGVHVHQITQGKSELMSRSTKIFATAAKRKKASGGPDVGPLHQDRPAGIRRRHSGQKGSNRSDQCAKQRQQ